MGRDQGGYALQMPGTGLGHSQGCSRAWGGTGLAVSTERLAGEKGWPIQWTETLPSWIT